MSLFTSADRAFVETVGRLAHSNPFLPERIEYEHSALGADFDPHLANWNVRAGNEADHPNLERILAHSQSILEATQQTLAASGTGLRLSAGDQLCVEDLFLFVLYHNLRPELDSLVAENAIDSSVAPARLFRKFSEQATRYLDIHPQLVPIRNQLPHFFAGFVQIRRAFRNIFSFIVGRSRASVQLRAHVWQSIFTHDMRRYRRVLYDRMGDFATLITGPSGTGKELVAQAIGLSQYIPFDSRTGKFADNAENSFSPISLAAMSPTLIESELFGHAKGAFTGAIQERCGWLELCPATGVVFLDEIGELDGAIQVKLLRVLQSREFTRLGENKRRRFAGKIIAATNRNLAAEMHAGNFREDLYYRLCSDLVAAPSLRTRLDDDPTELGELIRHIATRLIGEEADSVTIETEAVIKQELGDRYAWPGNVRELEQCVRNVLIRRSYGTAFPAQQTEMDGVASLVRAMQEGSLSAEEVVCRYCQIVYQQTGSYEATARKLGLDRRTVKAKVTRPPAAEMA